MDLMIGLLLTAVNHDRLSFLVTRKRRLARICMGLPCKQTIEDDSRMGETMTINGVFVLSELSFAYGGCVCLCFGSPCFLRSIIDRDYRQASLTVGFSKLFKLKAFSLSTVNQVFLLLLGSLDR